MAESPTFDLPSTNMKKAPSGAFFMAFVTRQNLSGNTESEILGFDFIAVFHFPCHRIKV